MRPWTAILCATVLCALSLAAAPPGSKRQPEFDKMKSLAGIWKGDSPDGKPVQVSYKVVSGGSAVMETIDHGDMPEMMVTMYHLDGDRLMMTHYCSAGNQPRMRLVSSTPTSLTFTMFDATNLASKNDGHMRRLVINWTDENHISADWTMSKDGKDEHHGIFKLARQI